MFICPKCYGTHFGTDIKTNVGRCHGTSHKPSCGFTWERTPENDAKVFHPSYDDLAEENRVFRAALEEIAKAQSTLFEGQWIKVDSPLWNLIQIAKEALGHE